MAPLRCAAKFDPFLALDSAPTPSTLAQSKERKGSNFAIWQPWWKSFPAGSSRTPRISSSPSAGPPPRRTPAEESRHPRSAVRTRPSLRRAGRGNARKPPHVVRVHFPVSRFSSRLLSGIGSEPSGIQIHLLAFAPPPLTLSSSVMRSALRPATTDAKEGDNGNGALHNSSFRPFPPSAQISWKGRTRSGRIIIRTRRRRRSATRLDRDFFVTSI